MQNKVTAIGVMSGTSLDGLDLAYCTFRFDTTWSYHLEAVQCIPYSEAWKHSLEHAHLLSGKELTALHVAFGTYIGSSVKAFLDEVDLPAPHIIASHGHTVFHAPHHGYTLQIGSGQHIAAVSGITTVNDFRALDVALGGQGAPLVPLGDALLFRHYAACLNLGGFSNISFNGVKSRLAFDICPVNIAMNPLAQLLGAPFDRDGDFAATGKVLPWLLQKLNALPIYHTLQRPSLSREWLEKEVLPLLPKEEKPADVLRTLSEHGAQQIAMVLDCHVKEGEVLVTGGGAYNRFLVDRIQQLTKVKVVLPDSRIVEFKEALVFAFLGVLRMRGEVNVLRSVTGASRDSCSGTVHLFDPSQHGQ